MNMTENLKDIPDKDDETYDDLSRYSDKYDEMFKMRKRPTSLVARHSKVAKTSEFDEESGEWRTRIAFQKKKFDDQAKGVFLEEYRKWGRIGEASAASGVTPATVKHHMKEDEEFAEAVLVAEEDYRNKLIGHHQNLVFNGQVKKMYDRNGNLVSEETVYPIRLIELELKKHDKGYRDKQEVDINHSGGVLVAPAEVPSIDDWEQKFAKMKDVTPDEE